MPQQWQFLRVNYAADYAAAEDAAVHDAKLLGRELAQLDHTDRHARPVTDAAWGERMAGTAAVENSDDPIISCLSCALLAAERGNDQYCADVLRLAITVRPPASAVRSSNCCRTGWNRADAPASLRIAEMAP